jgi:Zn-dependent peptidase ImmA (M78 family)
MLNKKAFAERIGVQALTISRWELRQSEPTSENLDAISRVLAYPKTFFFGPDIEEPLSSLVSFRSQESMSAATRDAALAAGAIGFRVLEWVGERFDLPTPNLPDLSVFDNPETAARALRQEWALGEKPISNMIHLLESNGIRVFSLAENARTVNAYSLRRSDGTPCVFLNTFKSAECSRLDAAHELAHLILHQDGSVKGRSAEDQANWFAGAFLMPKSDVLAALPRIQHLQQLMYAKARWRVSLAALTYRVHKLGLISDWKYRDFCIEISTKGYRKNEPLGIEREQSVMWRKVLKALWAEKTTHDDIARALDIPTSEISDLLFGVLNNSDPDKRSMPRQPLTVVSEDVVELPSATA